MILLLTVIMILMSSYVGSTPNIKDDSKTGYFVVVGILYALVIVGSILLGNGGDA